VEAASSRWPEAEMPLPHFQALETNGVGYFYFFQCLEKMVPEIGTSAKVLP